MDAQTPNPLNCPIRHHQHRLWEQLTQFQRSVESHSVESTLPDLSSHLSNYQVWDESEASVYLAPYPFSPHHLLIVAKRKSHSLEELPATVMTELESTRELVVHALQSLYGYRGYFCFSCSLRKQEPFRDHFCMELIPSTSSHAEPFVSDLSEKLLRFDYLLYRHRKSRDPLPLHSASAHCRVIRRKIQEIKRLKRAALTSNKARTTLPWNLRWTHIEKAWNQAANQFLYTLEQEGLPLHPEQIGYSAVAVDKTDQQDQGEFAVPQEKTLKIATCPFCDPSVISQQAVYTGKRMNVICNAWPLHEEFHFLITPKEERHIEDWQQLSKEELEEANRITAALFSTIRELSGPGEITTWISNGIEAGQTIPHTHRHVLKIPTRTSYYRTLINRLSGITYAPLSSNQVHQIRNKVRPKFLHFLEKQR